MATNASWPNEGAGDDSTRTSTRDSIERIELNDEQRPSHGAGEDDGPRVDVVSDDVLFHDPRDVRYADIHGNVMKLESPRFKEWLAGEHYDRTGVVMRRAACNDAVALLKAKAKRGPSLPVHVRVAREAQTVYLDLADAEKRPQRTPDVANRESSVAIARSQDATSWQPDLFRRVWQDVLEFRAT